MVTLAHSLFSRGEGKARSHHTVAVNRTDVVHVSTLFTDSSGSAVVGLKVIATSAVRADTLGWHPWFLAGTLPDETEIRFARHLRLVERTVVPDFVTSGALGGDKWIIALEPAALYF